MAKRPTGPSPDWLVSPSAAGDRLPRSRRLLVLALVTILSAGLGLGGATPASAAVNAISLTTIADGSAPFDTLDSGATNGVVRTSDVITYGWSYTSDGSASTPVTFVQTLNGPADLRFDASNTAQCNGGGAASISIDGHTLTCAVQVDASGNGVVPITVTVPATIPNDTAVTSTLTAAAGALTGGSRNVTIVGQPKLNLRANLMGVAVSASPGGVSGRGFVHSFVVTAPAGAKGTELVTAPLTFTADLNAVSANASLVPGSCTPQARGDWPLPFGRIGITAAATAANSVADSGAITCVQSGRTVTVTVTGADLSGRSLPTRAANAGTLVAESYLVSGLFTVFVPDTDIAAATGATIKSTIQYRGFDPVSVTGQSNYASGYEPGGDPAAAACAFVTDNGGRSNDNCFSTTYGGRSAGYDGSFFSNDVLYDRTIAGVPVKKGVAAGDATSGDAGDGVVSPGEAYWTRLQLGSNTGPSLVGAAVCDKWDPALGRITGAATVYRSGAVATLGTDYTVQYASLPMTSDADRRTTSCGVGSWHDTIGAAGGPSLVNAVRFQPKWTIANGVYDFFYVGYTAQENPTGTIIANFNSGRFGTDESWGPSYYVKATNSPTYTGDRLTLSAGRLRVAQSNSLPAGQFVQAGSSYTYTLSPKVTDYAPTFEKIGGITLVDTLSPCVAYLPGTSTIPVQLVGGSPGADGIPCTSDSGEIGQTLRFSLGSLTPNVAIDPVTFGVRVLRTTQDSTNASNSVVISSDTAVPIDLIKRTATSTILIRNQIQFAVSESTSTPVVDAGDDVNFTIAYRNVTGAVVPEVKMVTELPFSGDSAGSSFHGTVRYSAVARKPSNMSVECSTDTHGTINPDPASTANTWSPTCTSAATALRLTVTNVANTAMDAALVTLATAGTQSGDRLAGVTRGTYTVGTTTTAFPATGVAVVDVLSSSIKGVVWTDRDGDGIRDQSENLLGGLPVLLTGTDDRAAAVSRNTTSASDGSYSFAGMRPGTYRVEFDDADLPANQEFSPRAVGNDRSLDSDGAAATGLTPALVLGKGADVTGIDQGVRNVAPVATLTSSASSTNLGTPVTLTAAIDPNTATGTVMFTDAVVSGPLAGSSVTLGTAPVVNGRAVLSVALPAFGVNTVRASYGGDATHPATDSGTVAIENSAATADLIVSEFRLSGPSGATDQYVELTNRDLVPLPLAGVVVRTAAGTTVTLAKTAPLLAPGRSFLIASAGYSLGQTATPDLNVTTLGSGTNGVRVIAPDTLLAVTDQVGATSGYATGTALPGLSGTPTAAYSWLRLAQSGRLQDTGNNAADFLLVSAGSSTVGGVPAAAGSPSPSSTISPLARPAGLRSSLVSPAIASTLAPNRSYAPGTPGTLTVRRTITNTTGSTITAMRVRITSLSELNGAPKPGVATQPDQVAQLRAIEPAELTSTVTVAGAPVTVRNLVPDAPSGASPAAGINSTLIVPLDAGGLPDGAAVAVSFTFAVDARHSFWFGYAVEA